MVKLGQKVTCDPFYGLVWSPMSSKCQMVDAVVTYINKKHSWFRVEYGDTAKLRVCYKFDDIGKAVTLK